MNKPCELVPNGDTPQVDGYILNDANGQQLALIEPEAVEELNAVFANAGLYSV